MEICDLHHCTGCGMCSNICPTNAIEMEDGKHGFIYPHINGDKCINCGLCRKKCPANAEKQIECTMKRVYAAWSTDKKNRQNSTSGGIFSLLAKAVLQGGGAVIGVRWGKDFCPEYAVALDDKQVAAFRGSKYVQSNTGDIYRKAKQLLEDGKEVLFAGTPCQVDALKAFLGKSYTNLFTIDLVCHGVPSYECFKKYLDEVSNKKQIVGVNLRYKSPYWDYCSVRIDFKDGTHYQKYTVDDPYFTLFNIGYSLRDSCHKCKYATVHRVGDITLADFWGYQPSGFKMRNYNKGVSLVAVNTSKGDELFGRIKGSLNYELTTKDAAMRTNKSLSEPYDLPKERLSAFWEGYEHGEFIEQLCAKHVTSPFRLPPLLLLRRLKKRYSWILKH